MFAYMTTEEAAKKWRLSVQYIQKLCRRGAIPGVQKKGHAWFIPADAEPTFKADNRLFRYTGTKKRIFFKSIELFSNLSFEAVTLKDIADGVGIAQSAIYRHFASKREILDAIYGFYCHYFVADRPRLESLEPIMLSASPAEIFGLTYYVFVEEYREALISCTRIIFQRMSVDERAGEIFRVNMLESSLAYAQQVFQKAIDLGRFPKADAYAMSVYCNMARQTIHLNWLANSDRAAMEKLQACHATLERLIVQGLQGDPPDT